MSPFQIIATSMTTNLTSPVDREIALRTCPKVPATLLLFQTCQYQDPSLGPNDYLDFNKQWKNAKFPTSSERFGREMVVQFEAVGCIGKAPGLITSALIHTGPTKVRSQHQPTQNYLHDNCLNFWKIGYGWGMVGIFWFQCTINRTLHHIEFQNQGNLQETAWLWNHMLR